MEIEISKNSIKLLTYLDKFQRFSIPYEELIKPNELKNLLDYLVFPIFFINLFILPVKYITNRSEKIKRLTK